MKKLIITLLVLAAVLVGLDRGSVYAVSGVLASKVQMQQQLSSKPGVVIHGFPFLTQVVGGSYDEVDVTARGVVVDGVTIREIDVQAQGIKVALSDAIKGQVSNVPVRHGTATVHLDFADVNAYLAAKADGVPSLSYDGSDRVKVTAKLSAFGQTIRPSVDASIVLSDNVVRIVPLTNALDALPSVFRTLARSLLTLSISLTGLPFGIRLDRGTLTPDGVLVTASTTGAVFPVR